MRVSEIRVNQIRVNQGLGVYQKQTSKVEYFSKFAKNFSTALTAQSTKKQEGYRFI